MELFDTLKPPFFEKTGLTKDINQALADHDWLGTFNLWIVQRQPVPSIIYQQRSPNATWEPLKLDVSAGGYYGAGETLQDGLREVREELGKVYDFSGVAILGRRLNVSLDTKQRVRQTVVDIAIIEDDAPIETYGLQPEEVHAIFVCPVDELLRVHTEKDYSFTASGLNNKKERTGLLVQKNSFPKNWDNYHYKMATIVKRFLDREKDIVY
jgi:hypothetical protein